MERGGTGGSKKNFCSNNILATSGTVLSNTQSTPNYAFAFRQDCSTTLLPLCLTTTFVSERSRVPNKIEVHVETVNKPSHAFRYVAVYRYYYFCASTRVIRKQSRLTFLTSVQASLLRRRPVEAIQILTVCRISFYPIKISNKPNNHNNR